LSGTGQNQAFIIPAEAVSLLIATVPVRGLKGKRAALPFAIEDRISASLEDVHVALCRTTRDSNAVLAAVIDTAWMRAPDRAGDAQVLPETFALPAPEPSPDGPVWAVWCADRRALVRVSDGTGFCVDAAMLPLLWRQAGKPACLHYGDPIAPDIAATHRGDAPPPPDAVDLAVDLRQGLHAPASADWSTWLGRVAAVVCFGLLLHLVIAAVDARALTRIAAREQAAAQAVVTPILPGVIIGADAGAILRRLAPPPPPPPGSAFLPLLTQVSQVFLAADLPVGFRRMTFADNPARLNLLIEVATLEDLQQAERVLKARGLDVRSGAATASGGVAEAEFTIAGTPGQ
jgi:general secretion pathway protein L